MGIRETDNSAKEEAPKGFRESDAEDTGAEHSAGVIDTGAKDNQPKKIEREVQTARLEETPDSAGTVPAEPPRDFREKDGKEHSSQVISSGKNDTRTPTFGKELRAAPLQETDTSGRKETYSGIRAIGADPSRVREKDPGVYYFAEVDVVSHDRGTNATFYVPLESPTDGKGKPPKLTEEMLQKNEAYQAFLQKHNGYTADVKYTVYRTREKVDEHTSDRTYQRLIYENKSSGGARAQAASSGKFSANKPKSEHKAAKAVSTAAVGVVQGAARKIVHAGTNALKKADPLNKNINKNDISDTGAESIRLGRRVVKDVRNTVKQAKGTVKTVEHTAKTVKSTVKTTAQVAEKTAKTTVYVVRTTVQVASEVVVHAVALLSHPATWIVLIILVVIALIVGLIVSIMGGAGAAGGVTAYATPLGLGDPPEEQLEDADDYYRIACENNRNAFNALIDSVQYDPDNRGESDLGYLEKRYDGNTIATFETDFMTPERAVAVKALWTVPVTEQEADAIAYIYLEWQENVRKNTELQVYDIKYTQDVFNTVINTAVAFPEALHPNQDCPWHNCITVTESTPNPVWENYNKACLLWYAQDQKSIFGMLKKYWSMPRDNYGDGQFLDSYWDKTLVPAYNDFVAQTGLTPPSNWANADVHYFPVYADEYAHWLYRQLSSTPHDLTSEHVDCSHHHELHSIGLYCYTMDYVMDLLSIPEDYQEWNAMVLEYITSEGVT